MSNLASQSAALSLVRVLKQLSREWHVLWWPRADDPSELTARVEKYRHRPTAHPIFTLIRLIEKSTSFPGADVEWAVYHIDRPVERTPAKRLVNYCFTPLDRKLEGLGLLTTFATGADLQFLRSFRDVLNEYDFDGRTAGFLRELEAKHPGVLDALRAEVTAQSGGTAAPRKDGRGRRRRTDEKKARQEEIADKWKRFHESNAWKEPWKRGEGTATEQFCKSEGIEPETLETAKKQNRTAKKQNRR